MTDGQVLAGRYELGAVLGRGGMAEVRAGWDRRLSRAVAVKTLLPDLAERPGIRERFEGEARAAARLAHPNAVAVFDVGEEEGVPFIVMEQVMGPTLEQQLAGGPLDVGLVLRLGSELLAALGAAHAAGLVHRDVKPANVLITEDGSAKVADFGIAKAVADDEGTAPQVDLTTTGQMIGTVAYMAPERLAGRPATVRSDLYSVGVVLYEALSGARAFAASTPIAVVRAIDEASPVPLRERRPGLDPRLIAVVERAMAKNPDDRFASAADMSAALADRGAAAVHDPSADRAGPAVRDPDATPTVIAAPATDATPPVMAAPDPDADPTVMARPATEMFASPVVGGTEAVAANPAVAPVPPAPAAKAVDDDRRPPAVKAVDDHRRRPVGAIPRRRILAVVAIAGLAVVLGVAALRPSQHPASTAGTPTTVAPAAGAGLPPALDDALVRLEKTVR